MNVTDPGADELLQVRMDDDVAVMTFNHPPTDMREMHRRGTLEARNRMELPTRLFKINLKRRQRPPADEMQPRGDALGRGPSG